MGSLKDLRDMGLEQGEGKDGGTEAVEEKTRSRGLVRTGRGGVVEVEFQGASEPVSKALK